MADKYDTAMNVRMTPELSESVSARAKQAGMSRAEYIRLVLSLPIIIDPCGPKASHRVEKFSRGHDFLFDFDEAFGPDSDSDAEDFEAANASNSSDFNDRSTLLTRDNSTDSKSVITSYKPSEGVAEALAKLDYCVHAGIVPQFQPRDAGRPRTNESPDRYAIETIKTVYITDDEVRDLKIAINRWGTNLNQSTHSLNAIAKVLREQNIGDDDLYQYLIAGINNIDALLNVTIEGVSELIQMMTKLLSSHPVVGDIVR